MILPEGWKVWAGGAVVLAGSVFYASWQGHLASEANQNIQLLEKDRDSLDRRFADQEDTISRLNNIITSKEVAVADLRTKIANLPKPKPPVPIPTAPEEQVRYFQGFHLAPVVVPGSVGSLAFPANNLPIIGKALQDSENLSRVSEQLRDTELLNEKLGGLGAVKGARIAAGDSAISTLKVSLKNCDDVNQQYQKQVNAQRKQSRVEKVLWGFAGVGVGFLVAKR